MAPLVIELNNRPDEFESIVTVKAQHREMLDQVLKIINSAPDYDLDIMKKTEPDIVLVHGDTTTTFVASHAAFYNQITIGHVEAGLRTWSNYSPYPEEMNRQLTGVMADLHFAPTEKSKENLINENKLAD